MRSSDECLNESDLSPRYLELELTESILLENADVMLSVVRELNAMGLGIAIDDFGTGYSSFSYLRQFRARRLKIDRSFIQDVASKSDDAAIATAIISMAKSLNLKVIAEGVENEAQLTFLQDHHCDEIQGYYFSKPLTADSVADKIREIAFGVRGTPSDQNCTPQLQVGGRKLVCKEAMSQTACLELYVVTMRCDPSTCLCDAGEQDADMSREIRPSRFHWCPQAKRRGWTTWPAAWRSTLLKVTQQRSSVAGNR